MTWSDEVRGYSDGKGWYYFPRQDVNLNYQWVVARFQIVNGSRQVDSKYRSDDIYLSRDEAKEAAREAAEEEAQG